MQTERSSIQYLTKNLKANGRKNKNCTYNHSS